METSSHVAPFSLQGQKKAAVHMHRRLMSPIRKECVFTLSSEVSKDVLREALPG